MDDERALQRDERSHDPSRVLALSDGVFAIILTLLVLEIHVPELSGGQSLEDAMREIRPSFTAFLISFVVVAIAWVGHRDTFALIQRTDRALVWLNFLYLLPLSVLPFGAALIARYENDVVALRVYGILLVAIVLSRVILWLYATNRLHLLLLPVDRQSRWAGAALAAVPGVAYAIAIVVAKAAPTLSRLIYAAVPVLSIVATAIVGTSAPPGSAEQDFT